jgi:hypothetical protein
MTAFSAVVCLAERPEGADRMRQIPVLQSWSQRLGALSHLHSPGGEMVARTSVSYQGSEPTTVWEANNRLRNSDR